MKQGLAQVHIQHGKYLEAYQAPHHPLIGHCKKRHLFAPQDALTMLSAVQELFQFSFWRLSEKALLLLLGKSTPHGDKS